LSLFAGFALYSEEGQPVLCKENPKFTKKEIASALSYNWKHCLKEDERVVYLKRSRLLAGRRAADAPGAAPAVAPRAADAPAVAPGVAATPAAAPPSAATPAAMRIVPINQLNPKPKLLDNQGQDFVQGSDSALAEREGKGNVFGFDCIDEVSKALYVLFWRSQRKKHLVRVLKIKLNKLNKME
jgi:hypothetical protein